MIPAGAAKVIPMHWLLAVVAALGVVAVWTDVRRCVARDGAVLDSGVVFLRIRVGVYIRVG